MGTATLKRLAAVCTLAASLPASAVYVQGDLIVGFTTQSGNDLLYDLGARTNLIDGKTWDISGALAGAGISLSATTFWGVIGNKNSGTPRTAYITADLTPGTLPSAGAVNSLNTTMSSIAGSLTAGNSLAILNTDANSWNQKTIVGPLAIDYVNNYQNPNTLGFVSIGFWETLGNNSDPTKIGTFSLATNGILAFKNGMTPLKPPAPQLVSITRSGNSSTVSFTTTNGATYTLYYTNSAGLSAPVVNWTASPSTVPGDGSTKSMVDPAADADRFYRVGAR